MIYGDLGQVLAFKTEGFWHHFPHTIKALVLVIDFFVYLLSYRSFTDSKQIHKDLQTFSGKFLEAMLLVA